MTTSHRPTWKPVHVGSDQGGNMLKSFTKVSAARDLPGHMSLKTRQGG